MGEVNDSNVLPRIAAIQSGDSEAIYALLHAGHSPNGPQRYLVAVGAWPQEEEASPLELAVLERRTEGDVP